MKIVINISDDAYEHYCNGSEDSYDESEVALAIRNGIAFPKNHGRLIDADQLMNYCLNQIDGYKYADCNVIARFPTVLCGAKNEAS